MYDSDLEGQIILFSLIFAIIDCNFEINQCIIFILEQNKILDKTSYTVELTLTLGFK
jgi:hypothetical protein